MMKERKPYYTPNDKHEALIKRRGGYHATNVIKNTTQRHYRRNLTTNALRLSIGLKQSNYLWEVGNG